MQVALWPYPRPFPSVQNRVWSRETNMYLLALWTISTLLLVSCRVIVIVATCWLESYTLPSAAVLSSTSSPSTCNYIIIHYIIITFKFQSTAGSLNFDLSKYVTWNLRTLADKLESRAHRPQREGGMYQFFFAATRYTIFIFCQVTIYGIMRFMWKSQRRPEGVEWARS